MALHEELEYAIALTDGTLDQRGLSHSEAMNRAEALQKKGMSVFVMHIVGVKAHEVDRYPLR